MTVHLPVSIETFRKGEKIWVQERIREWLNAVGIRSSEQLADVIVDHQVMTIETLLKQARMADPQRSGDD